MVGHIGAGAQGGGRETLHRNRPTKVAGEAREMADEALTPAMFAGL
jgi:hypothetical protein